MTMSGKRRVARRRRGAARGFFSLVKMALVIAVIVLGIIGVIRFSSKPNVFLNGVYVNGVSLGGYTFEEGYALIHDLAEQRLSMNAIELRYGDKAWTLTPAMLNASMDVDSQLALAWNFGHTGNFFQKKSQQDYLKQQSVEFNSDLVYDEAILDHFIADIKSQIDIAPVDATVIVKANEQLEITDSFDGLVLDAEAVKQALADVIVEGSAPQIELVAQVAKPSIASEALRNGTQLIATCTTSTKSSNRNRTTNIHRALSKFNGFVVHPGDTVSFNKIVGRRTVENGFKEAEEFAGTSVQSGIGGGVCQASTTLYNALLRAGITVEVRHQHTMVVSYIPSSLDATVSDSGKDLVFTNNRDSSIYIYTNVDTARAQVNIYGVPTEYKIELESEIIQDNIAATNVRKRKDTTGKRAYYTDEMVLASEGKMGRRSRAYICYYDRATGELAGDRRVELHADYYLPSPAVYWVGIHERGADADFLP